MRKRIVIWSMCSVLMVLSAGSRSMSSDERQEGLAYIGKNKHGYEEYKCLKDGSMMVKIPAGEFLMGSNNGDSDERPVHKVYLDAYYIDKYEVTNTQFSQFLNEKGNQIEGGVEWLDIDARHCLIEYKNGKYQPKPGYENHAVIYVTWYGARAYARWAGKSLPSEAEWEKAARGSLVGKRYPWGDRDPDGSQCNFADKNTPYSWSDKAADDGYSHTAPVGSYPPNGYGLYDMAGNVWEWCSDWYDETYYSRSPYKNPQGPNNGSSRVHRGGCWVDSARDLRCASRSYCGTPDVACDCPLGFRCAKSP